MFACGFSTIQVVAGSLLSGILAYGVHFLHMVLDYGSVEEVQFEDEDYYIDNLVDDQINAFWTPVPGGGNGYGVAGYGDAASLDI